jgi:hypothetical protein
MEGGKPASGALAGQPGRRDRVGACGSKMRVVDPFDRVALDAARTWSFVTLVRHSFADSIYPSPALFTSLAKEAFP